MSGHGRITCQEGKTGFQTTPKIGAGKTVAGTGAMLAASILSPDATADTVESASRTAAPVAALDGGFVLALHNFQPKGGFIERNVPPKLLARVPSGAGDVRIIAATTLASAP